MLPQLKATKGGEQSSSVSSSQLEREEQVDVRLAGVGLGLATAETQLSAKVAEIEKRGTTHRIRHVGRRWVGKIGWADFLLKEGGEGKESNPRPSFLLSSSVNSSAKSPPDGTTCLPLLVRPEVRLAS